jgi:hypothetical protein
MTMTSEVQKRAAKKYKMFHPKMRILDKGYTIKAKRSFTMPSEAQKRAAKKFKEKYKEKVKRITVDFYPADAELWEHIQSQNKKQTYIKDLIRRDMKGE